MSALGIYQYSQLTKSNWAVAKSLDRHHMRSKDFPGLNETLDNVSYAG